MNATERVVRGDSSLSEKMFCVSWGYAHPLCDIRVSFLLNSFGSSAQARDIWTFLLVMVRATLPRQEDKILILKEHWLNLILGGRKTLEIRGRALKAGKYWLGCRGVIRGKVVLGDAVPIPDEDTWDSLRERHRVESSFLPYKKTYGLPVTSVKKVKPVTFKHTQGAVGIVLYRAP